MSINTDNHTPSKLRPYRSPFAKYTIVDKAVNDMLAANTVCPFRSPWSFPIVVVDKRDSTKRFCTDSRKLSNTSKKSSWPLLVTDNMLAALGKVKYFTTLNLKSGYWQIPLNEGDKEKLLLPVIEVCMCIMSCLLVWPMLLEYSSNTFQ